MLGRVARKDRLLYVRYDGTRWEADLFKCTCWAFRRSLLEFGFGGSQWLLLEEERYPVTNGDL